MAKRISAASLCFLLLLGQTAPILANPTGGTVVSGSSTIASAGSTETITQTTKNSIINWQTFSINGGETTKFIVPNQHSATLNRVTGGDVSSIYGTLESNGKIILINPNGVMVGPNGRIDTSSFIGSTLDVSNDEFLKGGDMSFIGSGGSVVNDGTITASNGGVYLIASEVTNNGSISAPRGDVGLAAGTDVLFQQKGDQHLFIQASNAETPRATGVTQAGTVLAAAAELKAAGGNAYALAINNTGQVTATGYKKINGQVILTADTGDITNSGSIRATTGQQGGRIELGSVSGTITNSGSLDASAIGNRKHGGLVTMKSSTGGVINTAGGQLDARGGEDGQGGNIEMSGGSVQALGVVDTTAVGGKTGMFTIDPATFTVAATGGDETGAQVADTLATTDVTLNADNAVTIDDSITWTSTNTLTLSTNTAGSTIAINDPISGVNGGLTINTAAATDAITATGAVTVANFILQSGNWSQNTANLPTFVASHDFEVQGNSTFLRVSGGNGSANSPYQITDVYGLQGMASTSLLGSDAELMNNIDATGTATWNGGAGFVPIGTSDNNYTGTFNGQGNIVADLTINESAGQFVGLFGYAGTNSVVMNLGADVNVLGNYHVGGLVGEGDGLIEDCFTLGTVTGSSEANSIGGLVGSNGGTISDSYSGANVSAQGSADQLVAGLVGINYFGTIENCYAYGSVSSPGNIFAVGGLVGNNVGGTITNTYSSGAVSGDANNSSVGGLIGYNSGTISGSFWDTTTAGSQVVSGVGSDSTPNTTPGVTGETTSALLQDSTYSSAGWNIGTDLTTNTWVIFNGQTRPMLAMEYSTTITNGHQLQLVGLNSNTLTANYTLATNVDLTGTTNASDIWGTSTTNGGGGFVPIGTYNGNSDAQGVVYHGIFNGAGFAINGLYIDVPNSNYIGLFGDSGANTTIENLNLTNVNVTGNSFVAGLDAVADSTFYNDSSSGTVTGDTYVGGLLGNVYGSVNTSFTTGTVVGSGYSIGGLAGLVQGGTVDSCYSAATVSAPNGIYDGGLIGENGGAVTNVFSTGTVSGNSYVGGLVGYNYGSISKAYTTSPVSGTESVGAFAGADDSSAITESFWDTQTAGTTTAVGSATEEPGLFGVTTAQLMSQSYILSQAPDWDFVNTWTTHGDTTLPQLIGLGGPGGAVGGGGGTIDALTGTVYIDSGETDAAGVTLDFLYDGTLLGTTVSGDDGQYTFNVNSTDLTGGILITDATDHGNTYFQSNDPEATNSGVDLYGSTLRVLGDAASNSGLGSALGSLTGVGANYSVSGSHLTTNSGINMSVLGTYTLDGNITSAGTFSAETGSKLIGSAAATVTGTSIALSGTMNRTGSTTFTSTSGGIDLEGVGNVDTAATADGLTLDSAQNVTIDNSYIDLAGGNLSVTGTGYTSLVDGNGDASGVDITDSVIHGQGGNLVVNGFGGYDTFQEVGTQTGDAIFINNSTLDTTGSGDLTVTGIFNHNIESVSAIAVCEIYGSTFSVGSGALSISGTLQQGSAAGTGSDGADVYGLIVGNGTALTATDAGGSISLTGNVGASTSVISDDNFDINIGLYISGSTMNAGTSGTITLSGTGGTINAAASTATGEAAPNTLGIYLADGSDLATGSGGTISVSGTGGAVTTSGGAYTGDSYGTLIQASSLSESSGGAMTVTGHGGAVNAGIGDNAADATSVGLQVDDSSLTDDTSGSITLNGFGGALNASQAGTFEGMWARFPVACLSLTVPMWPPPVRPRSRSTARAAPLTSGDTLTGGSVGVDVGGNGEGHADANQYGKRGAGNHRHGRHRSALGDGVLFSAFNGGETEITTSTGNMSVTGTGGTGYNGDGSIEGNVVPNYGIVVLDNVQINTGGTLGFTGTAGHNTSGGTNSDAVEIEELADDPSFDTSPVTPLINAAGGLTVTSTYGGVDLAGTASSNYYATIVTPASSNSTIENSGGPYTLNGGNFSLTGSTANVAAGSMGNLTIDVTGNIALGT